MDCSQTLLGLFIARTVVISFIMMFAVCDIHSEEIFEAKMTLIATEYRR